jgi:hypothetical protein
MPTVKLRRGTLPRSSVALRRTGHARETFQEERSTVARNPEAQHIYEVADLFRQRCLIDGVSLLWPNHKAWTLENLDALWDAFIGQPDQGKRSFME